MDKLRCDNLRILNVDWACELGIPQALLCQQILYWCQFNRRRNHNFRDGHYWTYQTIEDWQADLPCFSRRTIARAIAGLRKSGHILTARYNDSAWVRTVWYRLNPDRFEFPDFPIVHLAAVGRNGKVKGVYKTVYEPAPRSGALME